MNDAQVARPEVLLALKATTNCESVRERIRLAAKIAPMSLQETCAYIDHGLTIAECSEQLFPDEAKARVFKRTHGIARRINTVCYRAILQAAVERRNIVDS